MEAHHARLALGSGCSPGPPYCSDFAAVSTPAQEQVKTIRLEPRDANSRWHVQCLQHRSAFRFDAAQITLVFLPGAMPELLVNPSDPCDKALRFDRAHDLPRLGVHLVDLALSVLAHPE